MLIGKCFLISSVSGVAAVTIAAEANSRSPTGVSIGIGVAGVTDRACIGMPVSFHIVHEKRRMRSGVVALYSIRIIVTCYANRIGSLCIVARRTTFDVSPCILCMSPAATANAERNEVSAVMPYWLNAISICF